MAKHNRFTYLSLVLVIVAALTTPAGTQEFETFSFSANGKVMGTHCVPICEVSSSGTEYHVSFKGQPSVGISGTVSIKDSDTGVRVTSLDVVGFIIASANSLEWLGTCEITTQLGTMVGDCFGSVFDNGEPGSNDIGQFSYSGLTGTGSANSQFASGGAQIR